MPDLTTAAINEIPRFVSGLIFLALAWIVGQGLTVKWNLRQKRREFDLVTARDFHSLYGEFFALWKLWNYFSRDIGADALSGGSRWELLKRACDAEGKLEATLVRLACDRTLAQSDIERLGQFRQLYQTLRQSIRDNKPLEWDHSEDSRYVTFKELAPEIARLIVSDDSRTLSPGEAAVTLRAITSNRWEHLGLPSKKRLPQRME